MHLGKAKGMDIKMNILFTICGRAGSKGIRNKNIRNFLGYPLLYYSLEAINLYIERHHEHLYCVVVNTDSRELVELANRFTELETITLLRPKELAGDFVAKIDVIRDCIERMPDRAWDVVVDLDITSPLRKVSDIENLIDTYQKSIADIVYSVCPSRRNPYFNMVKKTEYGYERVIMSDYVSRQQAPEIYDMNASLYAYQPSFLTSGKQFNQGRHDIIFMRDTGVLDLDKEEDFGLMEAVAKYLYDVDAELGEIYTELFEHCERRKN